MARILIIEDEHHLAQALRRGLRDERHVVDFASDGISGLRAAKAGDDELLVLDLMLPGLPGLEVCRRLRAAGHHLPIHMLTARDTTADIVAGLDDAGDDYLPKPFAFEEMVARVRSLLRRSAGSGSSRIKVGAVELDAAAHRVWRVGEEVAFTAKEFQLLSPTSPAGPSAWSRPPPAACPCPARETSWTASPRR